MNLVFDVFTPEDLAAMRESVEAVLNDVVSGRTVTYHSATGTASLTATSGTAVSPNITRSVRAWRGAPEERTNPGPDMPSRLYIILKRDLDLPSPAIVPGRGDWITDDDGQFAVAQVRNGEIGSGVYYLLDVEHGGP